MSKVVRNKTEAEQIDKETDSLSKEYREILNKIEDKKKYWAQVFADNKIKHIVVQNGFIIAQSDHKLAIELLKNEYPISAETAALHFNYADLSEYDNG